MHVFARVFILMPHVRQIRAQQHDIAIDQRRDVIAHDSVAAALQRQRDLKLRMEMPARAVVPSTHDFTVKGLPITFRDFFKDRLHEAKRQRRAGLVEKTRLRSSRMKMRPCKHRARSILPDRASAGGLRFRQCIAQIAAHGLRVLFELLHDFGMRGGNIGLLARIGL